MDYSACMLGNIYTDQKCYVYGGKLIHDERRRGCFCLEDPKIKADSRFTVWFGRGINFKAGAIIIEEPTKAKGTKRIVRLLDRHVELMHQYPALDMARFLDKRHTKKSFKLERDHEPGPYVETQMFTTGMP